MRRFRTAVLVIGLVSLLLGPASRSAQASASDWRLEATAIGNTNPQGPGPGVDNRTVGGSSFTGLQINAVIDCKTADGVEEHVVAVLNSPHDVVFTSDDDILDGFGNISPTDTSRQFRDAAAAEVRSDLGASPANVEVRIVEGSFTRTLGVVDVQLLLDIRVERDPDNTPNSGDETLQCQTRDSDLVPVTVMFELLPDTDGDPTSGFFLAGIARDNNQP